MKFEEAEPFDSVKATDCWHHQTYQSGTQIVTSQRPRKPWLYIYGPGGADEDESDRNRAKVCKDIRDYLNHADRPEWFSDLRRVSDDRLEDLDGTSIAATGPMLESAAGRCDWKPDDSDSAKADRKQLIDAFYIAESEADDE